MNIRKLSRFISQNLRRNRKNFIFSSIGIVVGISSFVFFVALGSGIKRIVATEIFPQEANRIQVVSPLAGYDSSGSRRIDEEVLQELARIPGVTAVYPRMKFVVPATMTLDGRGFSEEDLTKIAGLPGITPDELKSVRKLSLWIEIMADGIDPRLARNDILFGEFADPAPGQPIPILLSKRLVEIYNASFARVRRLPPISEIIIPYIPTLPLTLNDSYVSRDITGPRQLVRIKLVGTSHHALLGGITMPLETIRKFNRQFGGEEASHIYDMAVLEVISSDRLSAVQLAIRKLGFDIDTSQKRMAESVGFAVTLVTLGFTLISLAMVGVAAINIGHTFFMIIYERQREIGLLKALGASKGNIRSMIFGEAVLVGTAGGAAGAAVGVAACGLVNWLAVRLLPEFPFKPDQFFAYPGWMLAGGVLLAVAFCLAGAFSPANRAAKFDPASTLSGR
ncbi:MAG: FtsX-like permease family protein [Candidatus Aminicenantales bacterium]